MIDVENYVFNAVYQYVAPKCAKNAFRSVTLPVPTAFPACDLWELSNITDMRRRSTKATEDYATVTFQARAYGKTKSDARKVICALDEGMEAIGFSRISCDYVPNNGNTVVHEYVARYWANVDQNGVIYLRR